MSRPLIAVTDFDYRDAEIEREVIEGAGFEFRALQTRTQEEIVAQAHDAVALINQYAFVGSVVMDGLPKLRHIARYGLGTDIVDVALATERGIQVSNVPATYCQDEVADHALSMLLYFARGLGRYGAATARGEWRWDSAAPLHRLSESTVGIVGLGNIGKCIARRCLAFGPRVLAYDPVLAPGVANDFGVEVVTQSDLLGLSDYVILQVPLTSQTRGMIDAKTIAQMKRNSVLINTSRGPLVDTAALEAAINSGHLRGAALDDLPEEPSKQRTWAARDPVLSNSNVIVTPHAAYYSEESIAFCRRYAAHEAVRAASNLPVLSPVNSVSR